MITSAVEKKNNLFLFINYYSFLRDSKERCVLIDRFKMKTVKMLTLFTVDVMLSGYERCYIWKTAHKISCLSAFLEEHEKSRETVCLLNHICNLGNVGTFFSYYLPLKKKRWVIVVWKRGNHCRIYIQK